MPAATSPLRMILGPNKIWRQKQNKTLFPIMMSSAKPVAGDSMALISL